MKFLGSNTLKVLGIASLTLVASLALMAPRSATADAEPGKTTETLRNIAAQIVMPKLAKDDCTIALKTDKEKYAAGEKPVVTVEFKNTSDAAIERTIEVSMSARDLESRSRMPARPVVVWKSVCTVTLAAGETKSVELSTDTEIKDKKAISFTFGGKDVTLDKPVEITRALLPESKPARKDVTADKPVAVTK